VDQLLGERPVNVDGNKDLVRNDVELMIFLIELVL